MKILSFDPLSLASSHDLDRSKMAYHTKAIRPEELGQKHGIVILGLADDTGVKNVGGRVGAKDGPSAARQKLYKFTTGAFSVPVYDLGDLLPADSIEETHEQGRLLIAKIIAAGHFPIVLGGGHDLAFPHSLAFLQASSSPARFWNIDAHLDVRPVVRGITSGSPWYLLREHPSFKKAEIHEFGLQRHCNAQALVNYAEQKGFTLHWLPEIKKPELQFAKLLAKTPRGTRTLVSLDIDSVRWSDAPGCSAPQTEGFSASEAIAMSRSAGAHPSVQSFGVFELCPPLDPDGRTANLVAHCLLACIQGIASRKKRRAK